MTTPQVSEVTEIPRRPEANVCVNCQQFYADTHHEKDEWITRSRCNITHQIVSPAMFACKSYRPIRACR